MSLKTIVFIFTLLSNLDAENVVAQQDFFSRAETFFTTYIDNGQVEYSVLKSDPVLINELIYDIGHMSLDGRSVEYTAAFYINAYNILVIKNILDHWKVNSPLDVEGFFDQIKFHISNENLTLNEIESAKLRKDFGDPRIHFAIVCAGNGCPPLTNLAFLPSNVINRLTDLTKSALNSPKMVVVDDAKKRVYISKIFQWYEADFGKSQSEVIAFINRQRDKPIPANYAIDYLEYDWSLNGK